MSNKKQTSTFLKAILTLLYRLYVLFIFLPLFVFFSVFIALITTIGCLVEISIFGVIILESYGVALWFMPFCCL